MRGQDQHACTPPAAAAACAAQFAAPLSAIPAPLHALGAVCARGWLARGCVRVGCLRLIHLGGMCHHLIGQCPSASGIKTALCTRASARWPVARGYMK